MHVFFFFVVIRRLSQPDYGRSALNPPAPSLPACALPAALSCWIAEAHGEVLSKGRHDGLGLLSDIGTLGRRRPRVYPAGAASRVWGRGRGRGRKTKRTYHQRFGLGAEEEGGFERHKSAVGRESRRDRIERLCPKAPRIPEAGRAVCLSAGGPASCQVSRYCRAAIVMVRRICRSSHRIAETPRTQR